MVFTEVVVYFRECPNAGGACVGSPQSGISNDAANPRPIRCAAQHFQFSEQYRYNYPGSVGGPVKIVLNWTGRLPSDAINSDPQVVPEETVGPGGSASHIAGPPSWDDTATESIATGTGFVQFNLSTQPTQGGASSQRFYYMCH
jgi:hypothetical protein